MENYYCGVRNFGKLFLEDENPFFGARNPDAVTAIMLLKPIKPPILFADGTLTEEGWSAVLW